MSLLSSVDPLIFAYTAILTMAIIPIIIGSYRSVPSSTKKKEKEVMSSRDAYLSPIIGSVALFSLYLLVKFVSKELINIIITGYVTFFGSICLIQLITPEVRSLIYYLTGFEPCDQTVKPSDTHQVVSKTEDQNKNNLDEPQTKNSIEKPKNRASSCLSNCFSCILTPFSITMERGKSCKLFYLINFIFSILLSFV